MDGVGALLFGIGSIAFGTCLAAVIGKPSGQRRLLLLGAVFGALLMVMGTFWVRIALYLPPGLLTSLRAVAQDGRVWLALVSIMAAGFTCLAITALGRERRAADLVANGLLPVISALELWVHPRSVSPAQKQTVADYLQSYPKYTAIFRSVHHDDEAANFLADIAKTLQRAGWAIEYRPGESTREVSGASINRIRTTTAMRTGVASEIDPAQIVLDAFRRAGIDFEGGPSGSPDLKDIDGIEVVVGPRRRGARKTFGKWRLPVADNE